MAKGLVSRTVQFEEIGASHTTYKNDPNTPLTASDIGKAVVLIADKTVGLGWNGADVIGILKVVEDDGYVTIQDGGYKEEVPYAVEPAIGDRVVSDGTGKVKPAGSSSAIGRHAVVSKDTANQKVILKLG